MREAAVKAINDPITAKAKESIARSGSMVVVTMGFMRCGLGRWLQELRLPASSEVGMSAAAGRLSGQTLQERNVA